MSQRPMSVSLLVLSAVFAGGCANATAQPAAPPAVKGNDVPEAVAAQPAAVTQPAVESKSTRAGQDWAAFLGPHGTGVSDEQGLLAKWPAEGPPVLWKRPLGEGYAAPSVRDERLVVMHRHRDLEFVECLHAQTGETLWKHEYETNFSDPYGYNGGSRCAPILTETRCYTFGPQGRLSCLDLTTGKVVWDLETTKKWTIPDHFFGAGCTPILDGNRLYVLIGGQPDSAVVAFDAEKGTVLWEAGGKSTWDGISGDEVGRRPFRWTPEEMLVSYSTPTLATIHGRKHLLCLLRQGLASFDPQTGELNFKYWFRSKTHESVNAARPVVIGDQILLTAAYETGAALLKVAPDGKDYTVTWRKPEGLSCHWSTPLVLDGVIYGFSGRHEQEARFQAVQLETGNLLWESNGFDRPLDELEQDPATGRIRDKNTGKPVPWPFYGRGSKILADGKFIVLAERGTLALVEPSKTGLKEISRTSFKEIGYPSWAAPVLSRGRLYLRSESHLIALDLRKTNP